MAKSPPKQPREPTWTPDTILAGIKKLKRRLTDVEAFDPGGISDRRDPRIQSLETAIRETLSNVFGSDTESFRRFQAASAIDTAGINMNGTPHHRVLDGLVRGQARSIELLNTAIRLLQERLEDDFPDEQIEPDPQVMQAGVGQVGVNPVATIGAVEGIQGVAAIGGIGTANFVSAPAVTVTDSAETRFAGLQARVSLLESSLSVLRNELNTQRPKDVGMGHNQGPDFAPIPVEDLAEIDSLIALLKDQGPTRPPDPTSAIQGAESAQRLSDRIGQGLISVGAELAKGGAREAGKEILASNWTALSHWLGEVARHVLTWLDLSS